MVGVGPTLAQRRCCCSEVGPTLEQSASMFGMFLTTKVCDISFNVTLVFLLRRWHEQSCFAVASASHRENFRQGARLIDNNPVAPLISRMYLYDDSVHRNAKLDIIGPFRMLYCYVAICDRRNLWRCRNLWLKVSQFVTGVAICDGKCRNLWQRQICNLMTYIHSISINILFFHLIYTNVRLISRVCP